MARPEQLQPGQLNVEAKPVDVFVKPIERQIAKPAQPSQVPTPRGLETVQTAGTTYVRGSNSFQDFANALKEFTPTFTKTAQAAGLAFASWQMDQGEAEAMEAHQRALVQLDEQTEVGEYEYAAASRALAAKDENAGWLHNFLNPYKEMGRQRGNSKMAGQELLLGMRPYVQSRGDEIDYLAPDQGMGALQGIRADYINLIKNKYGVDNGSAGFTKYFLPAATKAGESLANAVAEDRVKYLDEMVPKQVAAQLRLFIQASNASGSVEYNGQIYSQKADPQTYATALQLRAAQIMQQGALTSGLKGGVTKRVEDVYKILQADSNFYGDTSQRWVLDSIPSNVPVRGSDGKPIIDPKTGQPKTYTLGQLYAQEGIDSRLKYGKAGAEERKRELTEGLGSFQDYLARQLQGIPPGPEQQAVASAAVMQYYNSDQNQNVARVSLPELQKIASNVVGTNNEFLFLGDNNNAKADFFEWLTSSKGADFNATEARQRSRVAAAQIVDPNARKNFLKEADAAIKAQADEQAQTKAFRVTRDKVIKEQISADVAGQYGMTHDGNKADVRAGSDRATTRYIEVADAAIQAWRAQNGRDPLDGEVTKIVRDAITDYRKKNPELDKQLYPGGKAGGPSLRPKAKPPEKGPAPALYQINQLDDIPNRAVVLRQYRELPVLQLQSILKMMDLAESGKALPVKFERAWRDAGAQSAWDFINTQLRMYPKYNNDRTPQEMEKIRRRLQAAAASVNAYVASRAVSETMPYLAGLGDWSMRVGMGA
jgi:hypothetical protein